LDQIRREARRDAKEAAAVREMDQPMPRGEVATEVAPEDQLGLIFMCCHPALDAEARVALTLRAVCGLTAAEVAAVFLVSEPTMAKRLVRARRKVRDSSVQMAAPAPEVLADRLEPVLRVVYLVFTEGHRASSGPRLVREELCDVAISLARTLITLLPGEPEVTGLLALLLLTDARRAARTDNTGEIRLLEEQDRSRYDPVLIAEGEVLLERALRSGRPGPYQVQAAIAACHTTARTSADTDWREIAALYGELLRYEPSPVHEANRAIAVAMAEGPSAGLVILDAVAHHPQLARWPALHVARADLLQRLGRNHDAIFAYQTALELDPAHAERTFIQKRISQITSDAEERD
jgi:RNA polymerase sigma-70 factor, ECF subfamily